MAAFPSTPARRIQHSAGLLCVTAGWPTLSNVQLRCWPPSDRCRVTVAGCFAEPAAVALLAAKTAIGVVMSALRVDQGCANLHLVKHSCRG